MASSSFFACDACSASKAVRRVPTGVHRRPTINCGKSLLCGKPLLWQPLLWQAPTLAGAPRSPPQRRPWRATRRWPSPVAAAPAPAPPCRLASVPPAWPSVRAERCPLRDAPAILGCGGGDALGVFVTTARREVILTTAPSLMSDSPTRYIGYIGYAGYIGYIGDSPARP